MLFRVQLIFAFALIAAAAPAEEPEDKVVVELRWLESKPIKGVTEEKGIQASDAPGDLVYPHKKPALVLTKKEVSEAKLTKLDLSKSNIGIQYMVALHLTKDAKAKLAADAKEKSGRMLTVTVDGHHWGVRRYELDDPRAPAQARAETFLPEVGFFPSEAPAKRLTDAFK